MYFGIQLWYSRFKAPEPISKTLATVMGELPMVHLFEPHSWEGNMNWWGGVATNS